MIHWTLRGTWNLVKSGAAMVVPATPVVPALRSQLNLGLPPGFLSVCGACMHIAAHFPEPCSGGDSAVATRDDRQRENIATRKVPFYPLCQ